MPQLEAIPGVRAASPVVAVPFSGAAGWDGKPAAEGQSPEEAAANPMLNMEVVAPGYFATLGVPVLRGRSFTDQDREDAPPVVVVSQSAAQHYWPGDDPIGKRLVLGATRSRWSPLSAWSPTRATGTCVKRAPASTSRSASHSSPSRQPHSRSERMAAPPGWYPTIRRVISETEPGVALVSAASFETFLEGPLAQPRMNAFLLAVFAAPRWRSRLWACSASWRRWCASAPESSAFGLPWEPHHGICSGWSCAAGSRSQRQDWSWACSVPSSRTVSWPHCCMT